MRLFYILLIACVISSSTAFPPQPPRQQTSSLFPETEEGLKQFLGEILNAARDAKADRFLELTETLEIPDYGAWFREVFGDQEGAQVEATYAKAKDGIKGRMRTKLRELSRIKNLQLDVAKREETSHSGLPEFWKAVLLLMQASKPIYSVSYKRGVDSFSLGYFFYVAGGFRGIEHLALTGLSGVPPMRIRVGGNVQVARLVEQPRPVYPQQAKDQKIQGTVHILVIIGRDGRILKLEVLSGDPILAQAAVEAVRQWRYQPTLLDGVPVEVVTTIDMAFTLTK